MSAIAIDWSGAKNPKGKIWIGVCHHGRLLDLAPASSREDAIDRLLDHFADNPSAVGGLDFAFSMPAWFLEQIGARTGPEFWPIVQREGERWLTQCRSPFWGRPGKRRPHLSGHFRRTEERVATVGGIRPKSVFQIGGAGAVGTGSIRGMPFLSRIRAAGVAVWPFDPPTRPVVVEIYPRLLTGAVVKSAYSDRVAYLDRHYAGLDAEHRARAASSEDAFDAAVSALRLDECLRRSPIPVGDSLSLSEGAIWPAWVDLNQRPDAPLVKPSQGRATR